MNRTAVLLLMAGVVVGFVAGYLVGLQQHTVGHQQPMTMPQGMGGMPGMDVDQMRQQQQEQQQKQQVMDLQIETYKEALAQDPENGDAMIALGNLYYDTKKYKEAIQYYEMALQQNPDNLFVQVDLATSYKYVQQIDRAIDGLEKVLEKDPNQAQALYNLGVIMLHDKNDLAGAQKYWSRLLDTGTDEIDLNMVRQRLEVIERMMQQPPADETAQ
ncbi:MAG: tetratricopeptide repeat protein [Acidobacteria bacterium]|nr:tetratricopeptide repeat protein [Acidobacteriota bacterium]